jgi:hypothetical protein
MKRSRSKSRPKAQALYRALQDAAQEFKADRPHFWEFLRDLAAGFRHAKSADYKALWFFTRGVHSIVTVSPTGLKAKHRDQIYFEVRSRHDGVPESEMDNSQSATVASGATKTRVVTTRRR